MVSLIFSICWLLGIISAIVDNTSTIIHKKPNILYIFSDDQSLRTVHAYPNSYAWI